MSAETKRPHSGRSREVDPVPVAPLRLIRNCFEFAPQAELEKVPAGTRGLYVLYNGYASHRGADKGRRYFDVVYVGIAGLGVRSGVRVRLRAHRRRMGGEWTHFSVFEVHENIRPEEIKELEGLFRHVFRYDAQANRLAVAKRYLTLVEVRNASKRARWMEAKTDLSLASKHEPVGE